MKKVRFQSPIKNRLFNQMDERECHSPRPFTEQLCTRSPDIYNNHKVLPYSNDPVQLFERSNSSPYPMMNKLDIQEQGQGAKWSPCSDLELSMLDASYHEPRKPYSRSILKPLNVDNINMDIRTDVPITTNKNSESLANALVKDDFFFKKEHLMKTHFETPPIQQQSSKVCIDKENNPLAKKAQILQMSALIQPEIKNISNTPLVLSGDCMCHHCIRTITINQQNVNKNQISNFQIGDCDPQYVIQNTPRQIYCRCGLSPAPYRTCCDSTPHILQCHQSESDQSSKTQMNAIDKKIWAIERYEQNKKIDSMEVEKSTNVTKEKREPTLADLFKIIKLQNEQLQLLQEKVDKCMSTYQQNHTKPVQNCNSEQVAIESVGNEQHKISIGVMTSFEMVRTSTIINKEVVTTNENSHIQCNKSQISIKEVLSRAQSPNMNFLEGIAPVDKFIPEHNGDVQNVNDEKTLNELSLFNVQVDNATTPLMSPEQSLYLDVRDYSDSEAESDDQSNVGWTYYNKVMTHVNGMLQDSDMPSSASALYRNTRQQMQTVQMQIDKTNVSVTKRVKFGDDLLGIHQAQMNPGSSDTSLKMNQLAAKYLKGTVPVPIPSRPIHRPTPAPIDMSFATRNYMERHKLLQGAPATSKLPLQTEMPRFLDITALKQQPKFL